MPGQPKARELDAKITERGGLEWVFEQVRDGKSYRDIAKELEVSAYLFDKWRYKLSHEDRTTLGRARGNAAVEYAEDQLEQADSPSAMSVARERAKFKQWIASRVDRESWGEEKGPQVSITLNALHLTALQHLKAPETVSPITHTEDVPSVLSGEDTIRYLPPKAT